MNTSDFLALIHPVIAIVFIFPLLGIVINRAWLTRQRRLEILAENKTKIVPTVGKEHLDLGRWLSGGVVVLSLIGLAYPIGNNILTKQVWQTNLFQVIFIILMFVLTILSLTMLYKAKPKHWRGIFATLTGMGIIILGCQDGVFRRSNEWYWSHYYYGIVASLLMIFSLAIVSEIYGDKSNKWRLAHIVLNCFALLIFLGQGMTGTRDLLEIPLSWQKPYIYTCDWANKTCPSNNN